MKLTYGRYAIIALAALAIMLPNLLWGPGDTDDIHYSLIWTEQFGRAMAAGNLYPRWLPDSFQGLGSPAFYFYPPAPYWLAGGIRATGLPTPFAVTATAAILLALSGMAMHAWLTERHTKPLLGALIYMAAPYHLMDIYVRGAMAESATFVFLPLMALSIARLPQRNGTLLLCLSFAGLLITHLPMAMLTALFLIAPLLIDRLRTDRNVLLPATLAGVLAIGLAAFYLLPALTLQHLISTQWLWSSWHRPTSWSLLAPQPLILLNLGFPAVAVAAMLVALRAPPIWRIIILITGLSSVGLIPLMWDMPLLSQVQFPWRLLAIVEFAAITALLTSRPSILTTGLSAGLILFAYGHWTQMTVRRFSRPIDLVMLSRDLPDAPEYLPAGFDGRPTEKAGRIMDLRQWQHLPRGDIITVDRAGPVMVGRAAFPIWQVEHDGAVIPSAGPIIHFDAPRPGTYRLVRVTLWQESVGRIISLIAALLLAGLYLRFQAISLLSKFPAYSPLSPIDDRTLPGWRGRSRQSGGEA
ncbi:integral membrane-like protein [Sphingobium limneticum]|uniref:Integral membrane-like protein n=1 Tax=Sphingobium limneticum TaxID=1007511 RepID=A0A5J5I7H3_9SPHN|nr:integral membrane-like protein [Sphingobium limneticum]KAA9019582.1 integral membrane-like protein [Sphingobium limneticum]KAA9032040.1 integral membrane-like protein [Sphingobium limneticum]